MLGMTTYSHFPFIVAKQNLITFDTMKLFHNISMDSLWHEQNKMTACCNLLLHANFYATSESLFDISFWNYCSTITLGSGESKEAKFI